MGEVSFQPITCTDAPHHGIVCTAPSAGAGVYNLCTTLVMLTSSQFPCQLQLRRHGDCLRAVRHHNTRSLLNSPANILGICFAANGSEWQPAITTYKPHRGLNDHFEADCFRIAYENGLPLRHLAGMTCTSIKLARKRGKPPKSSGCLACQGAARAPEEV